MIESQFIKDFRDLLSKHNIAAPRFAYGASAFDAEKPRMLYAGPMYNQDEIVAGVSALVEGKWFVAGEHVQKFERLFSQYIGVKDSVMVNSGSSADLLMIAAAKQRYGWEDGHGILVSPAGFPTTISAITLNGLMPVFVDIEWETLNADNNLIEQALDTHVMPDNVWDGVIGKTYTAPHVVGILVSPVLGNPPDMDQLVSLAEKYNVKLFLDGCDSLGSTWRGKPLASYAAASTCSFFPSHHISCGQGGMISSDDEEFLSIVLSMASWGKGCWCTGAGNMLPNGCCGKRFTNWLPLLPETIVDHRYVFTTDKAYNLRPLDMQGALGCVQMEKIDSIHEARRAAFVRIDDIFSALRSKKLGKDLHGILQVDSLPEANPSWFGYPIICPSNEYKRALIGHLEKHGIQTREYFAGNLLLQPGYSYLGKAEDYPNAQQVLQRVFFIGTAPFYTDDHFNHIEKVVKSFVPPTV